ncbi:ABC transporter ATP-binding protein [Jiangella asiatica]|nr:ABC transporter ATP-binding protein [Jiangella asiatica]
MHTGLSVRDFSVALKTPGGPITPVDRVSIDVEPGRRVALVGESGCGKSMMLRGILRFIPPSVLDGVSGRAAFDGVDLAELDDRRLRNYRGDRIAMVFQDALARLNPTMPVGAQVAEVLTGGGRERDAQVAALFRAVGLDSSRAFRRRFPHELSGGMRQRVLIAIALAGDPELLVADEPTTALDVTVQAQILDTIASVVRERGMALLVVTHDLGVVSETCEYVYVMYAGQIVESGPVDAVFDEPGHPYTQGLIDCVLDVDEPGEQRVRTIPGVVPPPGSVTAGCRFRDRCPAAHDRCAVDPPVVELGPGRSARCWLRVPAETVEEAS